MDLKHQGIINYNLTLSLVNSKYQALNSFST